MGFLEPENDVEQGMIERAESKIMKSLFTKNRNPRKVSDVYASQIIVVSEAERMAPVIMEWVNTGTSKLDRKLLRSFFSSIETSESLIISVMMNLVSNVYVTYRKKSDNTFWSRHSTIEKIDSIVFNGSLGFDTTWRLVENIVDNSAIFQKKQATIKGKTAQEYVCILPEKTMTAIAYEITKSFYPLPLKTPPIDWSYKNGVITGGYSLHQYPFIRTKKNDYDHSLIPQRVFDSVNYIQRIPWRINQAVLHEVETNLKRPERKDFIKNAYPSKDGIDFETDLSSIPNEQSEPITKLRAEYYSSLQLYISEVGDYESAVGKWRAAKMAVDIAKDYIGDVIYFPHNLDFRGRIYPIPIGLSPQGSDSIKAIIEYAEGEILNERGVAWCWAYLASLYGDDKIPFNERVERGKQLLYSDYKDAEEPYQFMAHQLEMQKWAIDNSYPVKTRIHLDACNSGSQFTSAITGDAKGCKATNVIPHPEGKRQDAYLEVAESSIKSMLKKHKEQKPDEMDEMILGLFVKDGRKICKRPVMVSNYGGTSGGRIDILYDLLREMDLEKKWIDKKVASRMSSIIGEAIEGVLVGGKKFEKYIHAITNLISAKSSAITWTTPDGLQISLVKYEKQILTRTCKLRDKTVSIHKAIYSDKLAKRSIKNSSAPNYIHSLDATLLRAVALEMENRGVKYSDWIHDSFGTSPNNVDMMLKITKEEFIKMIRKTPLLKLDAELRSLAKSLRIRPRDLDKIVVPQLRGFNYNTGLNCLMDSEWFFS